MIRHPHEILATVCDYACPSVPVLKNNGHDGKGRMPHCFVCGLLSTYVLYVLALDTSDCIIVLQK